MSWKATARLLSLGVVLTAAATPAPAQTRPAALPAASGMDLIVQRVTGIAPPEGGACTADLTRAMPAGKMLMVEAVRAYGFSKADTGGETPRFRMTGFTADMAVEHPMEVGYVNPARRYFAASLAGPVAVSAGMMLTATVELPAGRSAGRYCRFQLEGRLVDAPAQS